MNRFQLRYFFEKSLQEICKKWIFGTFQPASPISQIFRWVFWSITPGSNGHLTSSIRVTLFFFSKMNSCFDLVYHFPIKLGIYLSTNEAALCRTAPMWCGVVQLPLDSTANVCAWGHGVRSKIVVLYRTEQRSLWQTDKNRIRLRSAWACSQCMPQANTLRRYDAVRLHLCSNVFLALHLYITLCVDAPK